MDNKALNRQGIAIISVLIVIALISASISLMFQRFGRDLNQTQYILAQSQVLNHLYSLETWAKVILSEDDLSIDNLSEDWATSITPIQITGGSVFGKLTDLQSKLNINNLIDLKTDIYSAQYRSFFYDCINLINMQLQQQAMADTIFSYTISRPPKPKLFEQLAGLRNIQAISDDDYLKIKPHLSALPTLTPININTASKQVLSCIHPQLSGALVDKIISHRKNQAFATIDDFWVYAHSLLPNLTLDEIKENFPLKYINIVSDYFLLETRIVFEKNKLIGRSILYRKDGKITVMNRSYHQPL